MATGICEECDKIEKVLDEWNTKSKNMTMTDRDVIDKIWKILELG